MMSDGMKILTNGMMTLEQKQAVIANNLANVGTVGYRKEAMDVTSFSQIMNKQMKQTNSFMSPVSSHNGELIQGGGTMGVNGALYTTTNTSYSQGALKMTGTTFDLALDDNGKGFFTVQSKEGIRFTRNGAFRLSNDGFLVTADGAKVLGQKGPIKIQGKDFKVTENGIVKIDNREVDKFLITEFTSKNTLRKDGENKFAAQDGFRISNEFNIKQGYLEMSNVNAVKEMMDMMKVQKNFEASQKVMGAQEQALRKSVNEVGKTG